MSFSDDTYNTLKWIAQIALPALGTLYFALAQIWGLPFGEQIVGTITAIDAFLGALLKVSSDNYEGDGELIVDTSNPEKDIYSIAIPDYPDKLAQKNRVVLNVTQAAHMKVD
ncbi:MAG: phage holin [Aeriscardovia sp.]|nr:phage holin [Aeriscardovia sp.]